MSIPMLSARAAQNTSRMAGLVGKLSARPLSTGFRESDLTLRVPFDQEVRLEKAVATSFYRESDSIHLLYRGLMVPGAGINSLTGKPTGSSVVTHGKLQNLEGVNATTDGQESHTYIKVVESAEELFKQMSLTMSGGGSYGIFSGRASYDRSEMSKFNSQSTTIIAATSVVNAFEYFMDGKLEDHARKLAQESPEEFVRSFGDYYVQGVLRGGYYLALVNVLSESRDVQKKVAASVSASFKGFGGGSGSFNEETKAYSRFSEIEIQFMQKGGVGSDHSNLGSDFERLSAKINRFAKTVRKNPRTISVAASPYRSLDNFPRGSRAYVNQLYQRERLAEYDRHRSTIITMRNDLQFVQERPHLFVDPPSQSQLNQWQEKLSNEQNRVEEATRECCSDAEECPVIEFNLPESIVMPQRTDGALDQEESNKLGTIWHETESGWNSVWRRVGKSRLFEAMWTKGNEVEEALLEIRITGNVVQILRTGSRGTNNGNPVKRTGDCNYTGILNQPGKVSGNYRCAWGGPERWEATIS